MHKSYLGFLLPPLVSISWNGNTLVLTRFFRHFYTLCFNIVLNNEGKILLGTFKIWTIIFLVTWTWDYDHVWFCVSGCHNRYSLRASDFFEAVNKAWLNQDCLPWHRIISDYEGPALWKLTPLDLPDASLTDAHNFCRVLAAKPYYPVCYGTAPTDPYKSQKFYTDTASKLFFDKCNVKTCDRTGEFWTQKPRVVGSNCIVQVATKTVFKAFPCMNEFTLAGKLKILYVDQQWSAVRLLIPQAV